MKKSIQIGVGILISAVFLYFAFQGVDLAATWEHMKGANPLWLAGVALTTLYSNWARAMRWGLFLRHERVIGSQSLFRSTMIGMAANNVIPLRVGEAVRALSISKKEGLAFTTAFTTVILERIFDLVAMMLFLALTLMLVPIPASAGAQVDGALQVVSIVVGVTLVSVVVLLFRQDAMVALAERLLGILPDRLSEPLGHMMHAFLSGLKAMTDPRQLGVLLLYSVWVWSWFAAVFYCGAEALGLPETFEVPALQISIVVVVFVAIFIMIPAAPGFVGTFQAGCILALSLFGVPREEALSFALLVHAVQFVSVNLVGVYCFVRDGMSLRELQGAEEPSPEEIESAMKASR